LFLGSCAISCVVETRDGAAIAGEFRVEILTDASKTQLKIGPQPRLLCDAYCADPSVLKNAENTAKQKKWENKQQGSGRSQPAHTAFIYNFPKTAEHCCVALICEKL
jgi:hypothetical protein